MNNCCYEMTYSINSNEEIIYYDSATRSYYLVLHKSPDGTLSPIKFCPWCGSHLPEKLSAKWDEVLLEEYGIEDPIFKDADKVPEEFKTDEWWKKRGL